MNVLVSFQLLSHTVVIEPANPASSTPQLFPILVRRTGTRGMSVGDVLVVAARALACSMLV